jgi:hypothetical protein
VNSWVRARGCWGRGCELGRAFCSWFETTLALQYPRVGMEDASEASVMSLGRLGKGFKGALAYKGPA